LVGHDPDLNVTMLDQAGQEITAQTDSLTAVGVNEQTKQYSIHELAKPESQTMTLELSRPNFGRFKLTVYAYDQTGQLTALDQSGFVGPQAIKFKLDYNKAGQSSISRVVEVGSVTWQSIKNDLGQLFAQHHFSKNSAFWQLDAVALAGTRAPHRAHPALVAVFISSLDRLKSQMSPESYDYLLQQAQTLQAQLNQ
jgi:hypothetical protein